VHQRLARARAVRRARRDDQPVRAEALALDGEVAGRVRRGLAGTGHDRDAAAGGEHRAMHDGTLLVP
jgi:hypothetical protein